MAYLLLTASTVFQCPYKLLAVLVKEVENLRDQRGITGNRIHMVAAGNFYIGVSHLQLFHARDPTARHVYRYQFVRISLGDEDGDMFDGL